VATNGDAMAFTVALAMSSNDKPKKWLCGFWAIGMGLAAVVLITIGAGGVTARVLHCHHRGAGVAGDPASAVGCRAHRRHMAHEQGV
jgi:choline-glycine betaine transporter